MKTIWHANMETYTYSFDAYGNTEEEATKALKAGIRKHIDATGATEKMLDYDFNVREVTLGHAYLDGESDLTTW